MADYDLPVCARCDDNHERALMRMWDTPEWPLRVLGRLHPDTDRDLRLLVHVLAELMGAA